MLTFYPEFDIKDLDTPDILLIVDFTHEIHTVKTVALMMLKCLTKKTCRFNILVCANGMYDKTTTCTSNQW